MSKKFKKCPNPNFPFRRNPSDEGSYVEDKSESPDLTLVERDGKTYLRVNDTDELIEVCEVAILDEEEK